MAQEIKIGLSKVVSDQVTEENTALAVGSGCLKVYATPAMCGLMEKAAAQLMDELLPEDSTTVGTALSIAHVSATPVGMKVTARAEIVDVQERKITFKVLAEDEVGKIGQGTHERFIVLKEKFQAKTDNKKGR